MLSKLCFIAVSGGIGLLTSVSFAQSNINDAFYANEFPEPGAEVNSFAGPNGGTITLGYNLTPTTPGTFSTANLTHSDAFNGSPNVEGFFVVNNALVPAALINTSAGPLATNFGVTFTSSRQILLHPGNPGGNAFEQPASAAVLRYTVPTTGSYDITGDFQDIGGGIVSVDILVNGASILAAGAGSDALAFNELETLVAGDLLDFVVDDGGDIGADSTGLRANIALVPEPASLGVFFLGGLAMLARRRV